METPTDLLNRALKAEAELAAVKQQKWDLADKLTRAEEIIHRMSLATKAACIGSANPPTATAVLVSEQGRHLTEVQNEELRSELTALRTAASLAELRAKELSSAALADGERIVKLLSELKRVDECRVELYSALTAKDAEIARLREQQNTLQQQLAFGGAASDEKYAILTEQDETIAKLQSDLTAKDATIERLNEVVDGFKDAAQLQDATIARLESEIGELTKDKETLTCALEYEKADSASKAKALGEMRGLVESHRQHLDSVGPNCRFEGVGQISASIVEELEEILARSALHSSTEPKGSK